MTGRIAVFADHGAGRLIGRQRQVKLRRWVAEEGIRHFYDVGAGCVIR